MLGMGTSFAVLSLICKVSSIVNSLFPLLHETLYAGRTKFFAVASRLLTHAVFKHVVVRKTASSTCMLQRVTRVEKGGC